MIKEVEIEGKKVKFASNGRTLRLYRLMIGKDFLKDMMKLKKYLDKETGEISDEDALIDDFDFSIIEQLAFICAYTANSRETGEDIDRWLSKFHDPFSIIDHAEDIMEIIGVSAETNVDAKKNLERVTYQRKMKKK